MKRSLTDSGIHSVAPDVFNQSGHATLHVITPNYTTLDDKTLHYRRGVKRTLHDTILHYTMRHYTTLLQKRSLTDSVVHSVAVPDVFNQSGHVTVHFITPNYTTLHYTTLHYTTQHYTTLHYCRGVKRSLTDSVVLSVASDVFNHSGHATLHYITQNYATLHDKTLHYRRGVKRTLHDTRHDTILHYTIRHYTTLLHKRSLTDSVVYIAAVPMYLTSLVMLHYTSSHQTTLTYITLHNTTLHYCRGVKRSLTDSVVQSVAPDVFNFTGRSSAGSMWNLSNT